MSSAIGLLVLSTVHPARAADYTGDGIDDLAVGVIWESMGTAAACGGVEIIRGSTTGLTSSRDAFITQDTAGVPSANQSEELFGWALGAGDVDGDGKDDLIVGGPGAMVSGVDGGAIWRLVLSPSGTTLAVTSARQFTQDTTGISDTAESGDEFGYAITVGDFDGDDYDDVVVGIPGEDVGSVIDAGAVTFLPGGPTGLRTSRQIYYDQDVADVGGVAERDDQFGRALAAGDFDADGYDDLAIGSPYESLSGSSEGDVQVMYGSSTGPSVTSPDDERWSAGWSTAVASVAGVEQDANYCGYALTADDFDGDGYDDLAVGCFGYTAGGEFLAGAVLVLYGSSSGLDASELWSQDSSGVIGTPELADYFGSVLSSGDYDGDGYGDLAIGALNEDYDGFVDNGVVHVLFGSSGGLTDVGNLLLAQDTGSTVEGTPVDGDGFGYALASGDWNDDGLDDLAVGSAGDDETGGAPDSGVVNVFYGSASGPSTSGDQLFDQDTTGIEDVAESGDHFGAALR
jgi:hypothetical protein